MNLKPEPEICPRPWSCLHGHHVPTESWVLECPHCMGVWHSFAMHQTASDMENDIQCMPTLKSILEKNNARHRSCRKRRNIGHCNSNCKASTGPRAQHARPRASQRPSPKEQWWDPSHPLHRSREDVQLLHRSWDKSQIKLPQMDDSYSFGCKAVKSKPQKMVLWKEPSFK